MKREASEANGEENGIEITEEKCKNVMKSEFKKEVKKKIEEKMVIKMKENETTKMRTVAKEGFRAKGYLNGIYDGKEVYEILLVKLHMMNLKNNFKNKEEDDECRFCHKEKETTEHIMLACQRLKKLRGSSTIQRI